MSTSSSDYKTFFGLIGRVLFWGGFLYIMYNAISEYYLAGDYEMMVAVIIGAPITYFVYPWWNGLVAVLIVSLLGYWFSTLIAKFKPVG